MKSELTRERCEQGCAYPCCSSRLLPAPQKALAGWNVFSLEMGMLRPQKHHLASPLPGRFFAGSDGKKRLCSQCSPGGKAFLIQALINTS